MTTYSFANRKSGRHSESGNPVAVKGQKFPTMEQARQAMRAYARQVRVPETEFVVGPVKGNTIGTETDAEQIVRLAGNCDPDLLYIVGPHVSSEYGVGWAVFNRQGKCLRHGYGSAAAAANDAKHMEARVKSNERHSERMSRANQPQ